MVKYLDMISCISRNIYFQYLGPLVAVVGSQTWVGAPSGHTGTYPPVDGDGGHQGFWT